MSQNIRQMKENEQHVSECLAEGAGNLNSHNFGVKKSETSQDQRPSLQPALAEFNQLHSASSYDRSLTHTHAHADIPHTLPLKLVPDGILA